jgi:group I intron endonuclease
MARSKDTIVSGIIYALHNGDGVHRYVGYSTKTAQKRLKDHYYTCTVQKAKSRDLYVWMIENGRETIQIEVLESHTEITLRDLLQRERECIAAAKEAGAKLLNGTSGGQGLPGLKHTDEAKAKMSARHKGKTISEEQRKKISEFMKGHKYNEGRGPVSAESRAKMSESRKGEKNHNFGKPMSPETKAKMSAARKGKSNGPHSEESIDKMRLAGHNRYHLTGKSNPKCKFCKPSDLPVMV